MLLRIEHLKEKKLVGKHLRMSLAENKTIDLWKSFMPRRKEIKNSVGRELYSVDIFDPSYFKSFDPKAEFQKWAAVEMNDENSVPDQMEVLILPAGDYAVFLHKGLASEGYKTYEYIFRSWLPASDFVLDNRPHFAVMGEKYKNNNPSSEEEIWIPVLPKHTTQNA